MCGKNFEEARQIGKVRLENGNTPARPSLSEAARANMENFLEYIQMVLPALRIDCFPAQTRPQPEPATASPANGDDAPLLFELHTPRPGIHATARLEGGEFVVQAGSQSRGIRAGKGTGHPSYSKLLAELVTTGVLSSQDGRCLFTENYAFKSPSAAAAVGRRKVHEAHVETRGLSHGR